MNNEVILNTKTAKFLKGLFDVFLSKNTKSSGMLSTLIKQLSKLILIIDRDEEAQKTTIKILNYIKENWEDG